MDGKIDYDYNVTSEIIPTELLPFIPLYSDFQGYWYGHVYVLAFGFFSISFCCFFSAINIKSQYPLQSLMFIACILLISLGLLRSGFLMLDPYGAQTRLPMSLLTFLYSLGFPTLTATIAMTIFSIAKHCLRTEPKSFIWLIVLFHFCFSITAEIVAVNEESWRLFLQTVTAIFMMWPVGLVLLFGNIRKSLLEIDQPKHPMVKKEPGPAPAKSAITKKRKRGDRRRFTDSSAQTSFMRKPTPKAKSKSCGTINDSSTGGSQLTMPTSSVVSLDSLESWDHFSLQGSPPRNSPILTRHLSMPSVTTGRKFWTQRFAFRKNFRLPTASPLNWRTKKSSGNSLERETISGDDNVIQKDQDSTVINYFTSAPENCVVTVASNSNHTGNPARAPLLSAENQQNLRRLSATTNHIKPVVKEVPSLVSRKVWIFLRAHYVLLVFYMVFCGLYLCSVFKYPVDIRSQKRNTVWNWFSFQTYLRAAELMTSICLAYILDHAGALDECNIRQRDLLRI